MNNDFVYEALNRRKKMFSKQMSPFDRLSPGAMGMQQMRQGPEDIGLLNQGLDTKSAKKQKTGNYPKAEV